jgi:hypothetical protein
MNKNLCIAIAAAGLFAAGTPLFAHHSFAAEYDNTKPVEIKGTVTKVEWTNPHARFYVDAKDPSGKVVNWNFELASPNVLIRQGWTRHSLKEGDQISVQGNRAKDGANMANAATVVLADGKRVFARSQADNGN